jgi:predicted HTH domain antitoxin
MLVLDDAFLNKVDMTPEQIKLEIMMAAYREKKIGWGKAAEILGMTKVEIWKEISDRGMDVITADTYIDKDGNLTL